MEATDELQSLFPKIESSVDPSGQAKRVLSFFTGGGGLDLGFESAGFKTVYATDMDADSCRTLEKNIGNHLSRELEVECADITKIDIASLPRTIDLVIGGPPCQSFSASGRRAGGAAGRLDDRGNLFQSYCEIIGAVQPKAFVFENVRGILATNKGEDWQAIITTFAELGYKLSYRLLDALDYGAPQQRERMFLVGHRLEGDFLFPEPTHGPDSASKRPHLTSGEALDSIDEDEDLKSLFLDSGKYSHLLPLVPPGQNYLYFTAKRGYAKPIFAYRSRFSDFLYKADPQSPVKTIIASPGKYTGPLHWENRYFSLKEYKRLQGFPDDFAFVGNRASVIRQIGNSVSPYVAHQVALAVAKQVFNEHVSVRLMGSERKLSFDTRKGAKAQKTRALHANVARRETQSLESSFVTTNYRAAIAPTQLPSGVQNAKCLVGDKGVSLCVSTDGSNASFARMTLSVENGPKALMVSVEGHGRSPDTIQAMWNCVDDWVRRSSDFHSLFELYGHFTEPHPVFRILSFEALSNHPIASFAKHAAEFANCSRYFPRDQLVDLFGDALGTDEFVEVARYLRRYRFDIRSHETNVAIGPTDYMVAYPFTLPERRQMNFTLRPSVDSIQVAA